MAAIVEALKQIGIFIGGTLLAVVLVVLFMTPYFLWQEARERAARRARRHEVQPTSARRLRARMKRLEVPTLLLVPAKQPGFSKLGGDPELPPEINWPEGRAGPRSFVAQIDLGAFRDHGGPEWLPQTGRLYAFIDDQAFGFLDLVKLIYTTGASGAPSRGYAKWRFPERRVAFETYTSVPSMDWLGVDVRDIEADDEELDELADAPDAPFGDELQHRIGGYPSEIQDERMAISCELLRRGLPEYGEAEITPAIARASKQWRLLLQVDSDPALEMNWGDGGRLYVFIREKHALARDFSQTVTISQTY